jgi:hypothetical protein
MSFIKLNHWTQKLIIVTLVAHKILQKENVNIKVCVI